MVEISPDVPIVGNGNQGRLIAGLPISNDARTAFQSHGTKQVFDTERKVVPYHKETRRTIACASVCASIADSRPKRQYSQPATSPKAALEVTT